MTQAREAILEKLARARGAASAPAARYVPPAFADMASTFIAKSLASLAEMHHIDTIESAPDTIGAILRKAGAAPRLHVAKGSPLWTLRWEVAKISLTDETPTAADTTLSAADYAIAETGTLVFRTGPARPASWHFLPLREFVLVSRAGIVATLEDVTSAMRPLPSTLNLVTGPSRTGDIEQTLELGAHGPREVHVLLTPR